MQLAHRCVAGFPERRLSQRMKARVLLALCAFAASTPVSSLQPAFIAAGLSTHSRSSQDRRGSILQLYDSSAESNHETRRLPARRLAIGAAFSLFAAGMARVPSASAKTLDALPTKEQMERARRLNVPNIVAQYKALKGAGSITTNWARTQLDLMVLQMRVWNSVQRKGDWPDVTVALLEDDTNRFEEAARILKYKESMAILDKWLKDLPADAPGGDGRIDVGV
mmetsp:Transcript_55858/g.103397  ORF Transcript_55858/g.103397 Transcript_55858/m.103397 type:complete len:224 (+) Transcript_55858:72-743(+)